MVKCFDLCMLPASGPGGRRFESVPRAGLKDRSTRSSLRLVVIHMGSGISVSVHQDGRMIDCNTGEEGPFGIDRSGALPVQQLIKICFSGLYTQKRLDQLVFGAGGVASCLGTKDLMEVERRIDSGDERAAAVLDAMVDQIAKEAGGLAAVLYGKVDAVLLTGGMAHSKRIVSRLHE